MKLNRFPFFVILVFVSLGVSNCSSQQRVTGPSSNLTDLLAEANQLDSMFVAAFNKGDVEGFMQLYWNSPELTAYPPAGVMQLKGYNAVKELYTRDFAQNKGAVLSYITNTNVAFSDVVIGHGTFKWTLAIPGKEPIVLEARHTVVKTFKNGKMVIIIDHASAPLRM